MKHYLNNIIHLGIPEQQFVAKRHFAFEWLRYIEYEVDSSEERYARKVMCDITANREF